MPNSITTYGAMRTDAQIASLLLAFTLPIRRYGWYIDPNGARDEVVEDVANALNLPIEGQDPKPSGRRDRFSHDKHLFHALLMLTYGSMYFETVYRFDELSQRYRLRKLAPRMPGTISEIQVARDGGLEYIRQHPAGQAFGLGGKSNRYGLQSPQIPVDRLVAYVNDQEAGNWIGSSWLRPLYKHFLRNDRLLRVDAINAEGNGAGVPLAYAPLNATKDQIKELSALTPLLSCWRIRRRATPQWC